ncbi:MAG: PHP domain-containing protein [bacterium]
MLKEFKVDLHIHTCLSPCGDLKMLPTVIIKQAKKRNLNVIGICDHNSAENVEAVEKAGEREGLQVLGGLEITSREEVHILAFFNDINLQEIQNLIYENLSGENNQEAFGEQLVVDQYDKIIGYNKKLLIGATSLSVDEIVKLVHRLGGLAIASHIDKETFSIISQLGFIPEGLDLDALELSPNYELRTPLRTRNYESYGFPLVTFSDAHYLEDIGRSVTCFVIEEATVDEIGKALLNRDGRMVKR